MISQMPSPTVPPSRSGVESPLSIDVVLAAVKAGQSVPLDGRHWTRCVIELTDARTDWTLHDLTFEQIVQMFGAVLAWMVRSPKP